MEGFLTGVEMHLFPLMCVFTAAFLQSITGFGLVIVAAPLLMLFYDAKITIQIMFLLAVCANLAQTFMLWRDVLLKVVILLLIGTIIGQPLGFLVYSAFSADQLKLVISAAVLVSLILMQISHSKIRQCNRNTIISGLASGVMATTTGMGGPPIAMYFAFSDFTTAQLRATCIAFFLLSNFCSMATFMLGGVDMSMALHEAIYLLPGIAGGIFLGHLLFKFISAKLLKKIIFIVLYVMCIYSIYTVLAK